MPVNGPVRCLHESRLEGVNSYRRTNVLPCYVFVRLLTSLAIVTHGLFEMPILDSYDNRNVWIRPLDSNSFLFSPNEK